MNPRTRDALLLIAGLPGICAIFMPVSSFIFAPILPAELIWDIASQGGDLLESSWWMVLLQLCAVLLPVPIALLQLGRLLGHAPPRAVTLATLLVAAVIAGSNLFLVAVVAGESLLPERNSLKILALAVPLFVLAAANLWLLYRNLRRRLPLAVTAEVLLLATYTAAMTYFVIAVPLWAELGAKLIVWTCLVYLVTLVVRLRDSRPQPSGAAA